MGAVFRTRGLRWTVHSLPVRVRIQLLSPTGPRQVVSGHTWLATAVREAQTTCSTAVISGSWSHGPGPS